MEGIYNMMNRTGSTLDSESSLRLSSKPRIVSKGKLVDDIGTSGFTSKATRGKSTSISLSDTEKKRVRRDHLSLGVPHISDEDGEKEESDDEIDLLSSPRRGSDDDVNPISRPEKVVFNGVEHAYHPNYKPNNALKNLKFKKNKDKAGVSSPSKQKSSSSITKPQSSSTCAYDSKTQNMSSSAPSFPPASEPPPRPVRPSASQLRVASNLPSSQSDSKLYDSSSKRKTYAKPIQRHGSKTNPVRIDSESSTDERRSTIRTRGSKIIPMRSSADERRATIQKRGSKRNPSVVDESSADERRPSASTSRKPRKQASFPSLSPLHDDQKGKQKEKPFVPAAFPMSPPTKAHVDLHPDTSPLTPTEEGNTKRPDSYSTFPNMSPLFSPTPRPVKAASTFPVSPLHTLTPIKTTLGSMRANGKGVANEKSKESDPLHWNDSDSDIEEVTETKQKMHPFSMKTAVTNSPEDFSSASSSRKRSPISPAPGGHKRKKSRVDDLPPLSSSLPKEEDGDDDDFFYNPSVDAKTLCPYCDEPLPKSPTPLLRQLLATTATKSKRAPRPTNPMGRRAPVGVFISVCQRHRFESKILPEAEEKGWPKSIEWDKLEGRILKMRNDLKALIEDSEIAGEDESDDENDDWHIGRSKPKGKRARDICISWEEVVKEVREKGSKAAADVKNQFSNFEKTQPGYYGELGSIIIHQSLYELFPPTSIDPVSVAPLSPKEFIERVLVPEAAVRLIMEDRSLFGRSGIREALQVLRESSSYGVAMFPEDTGELGELDGDQKGRGKRKAGGRTNDLSVADTMVREKARKRRQELEEEEKLEELLLGQNSRSKLPTDSISRPKRKGRRGEKAPISNSNGDEQTLLASERPRPKPKPKAISKSASTNDIDDTEMLQDGQYGLDLAELGLVDDHLSLGSMAELDAMMDEYSSKDTLLTSSVTAPLLSTSTQNDRASRAEPDSDAAMNIFSDSDAESISSIASNVRSRRRGKVKKSVVEVDKRSPGVEIVESRSKSGLFDGDATPKPANTNNASSSSLRNSDESLAPLEQARRRVRQQQADDNKKSTTTTTNGKAGEKLSGRQSKFGLQKATSMCSTTSDADWLLNEEFDA